MTPVKSELRPSVLSHTEALNLSSRASRRTWPSVQKDVGRSGRMCIDRDAREERVKAVRLVAHRGPQLVESSVVREANLVQS